MSAPIVELLGANLQGQNDQQVSTADVLMGKSAVALYFSAHWCPPCRGFTPKLAEFYTKSLKAKGLEVVFVSSDRDEAAFKEYFGEMPWLALRFGDRERKEALSTKYKVRGIPSLVILDGESAEVITADGRSAVMGDPEGRHFPWGPRASPVAMPSAAAPAASTPIVELLGANLQGQNGQHVATADVLAGKHAVALYFSAHWCPPCRGFTPKLAEFYKKSLKAKGLEVVFVSSDRDEAAFKEYFGEMPWLALPFGDRARKEALSTKYKVRGIPSLVILDGKSAEVITADGRSAVMGDPEGRDFPWRPNAFPELLGDRFLKNAKGETVGKEALAGKVLGIYFSAHWCPPCRGFTPKLVETYKKMVANGLNFEVVFASSDRDEATFKEYYGTMPWLALPHGDKRKEQLSSLFGVRGIPSLVIVAPDGSIITKDGRATLTSDPEGAEFPWHPKPVRDVASNPAGIDEIPSILVFMETQPKEAQARITAAMTEVAEKYAEQAKRAKEDQPKYLFFAATNTEGPVRRLRELTKQPSEDGVATAPVPVTHGARRGFFGRLTSAVRGAAQRYRRSSAPCESVAPKRINVAAASPAVVLLNLDERGAYYEMERGTALTAASLERFIADFEASALERKQCGAK